eukprot:COSAG01_NODE_83_length_27807_cov_20.014581_10_plen_90_part_00
MPAPALATGKQSPGRARKHMYMCSWASAEAILLAGLGWGAGGGAMMAEAEEPRRTRIVADIRIRPTTTFHISTCDCDPEKIHLSRQGFS